MKIFNSTPHAITMQDGEGNAVSIPSHRIINAKPVETRVGFINGIEYVKTQFVGDDAGRQIIAQAKADGYDIVVGSIIAAQAYPGEVVAMVPAPGYERVPPEQKRMRMDKFTVFGDGVCPA